LHRRSWRFVFFALAILAGFAAGLGYGWSINPVQYRSTSPDTLQIDYRTDFVLMVAELYQAEGDLALALARLGFLGDTPPLILMNETISYGDTLRYADVDLQLMRRLAFDIQGALDGTD
jgi:hypothetical protein